MSKYLIGTLSPIGFITESVEQALDAHFSAWHAAKRSQGLVFEKVPSLEYLVMENEGKMEQMEENTRTALRSYFEEQFNVHDIVVEARPIDGDRDGKYQLIIGVSVIEDGVVYDLGASVLITGRTFEKINEGKRNATRRSPRV